MSSDMYFILLFKTSTITDLVTAEFILKYDKFKLASVRFVCENCLYRLTYTNVIVTGLI